MPKKKFIALIAVILICLALIAGGTYAYVTREATAHNVITTGKIDIEIVETQTGSGSYADPIPVMPGATVSKNARIKNVDGIQSAYIRARIDIEIRDIVNWPVQVEAAELAENIVIDCGGSEWTYKDGWWYYNEPPKAGKETTSLFEEIVFAEHMSNKYQNCTATVTVIAQAVQVKNNEATALEAVGWPA